CALVVAASTASPPVARCTHDGLFAFAGAPPLPLHRRAATACTSSALCARLGARSKGQGWHTTARQIRRSMQRWSSWERVSNGTRTTVDLRRAVSVSRLGVGFADEAYAGPCFDESRSRERADRRPRRSLSTMGRAPASR